MHLITQKNPKLEQAITVVYCIIFEITIIKEDEDEHAYTTCSIIEHN